MPISRVDNHLIMTALLPETSSMKARSFSRFVSPRSTDFRVSPGNALFLTFVVEISISKCNNLSTI